MNNQISFSEEVKSGTARIYQKLKSSIPDIEWPLIAPYIYEINKLKKETNSVILAHNYQTPQIFHGVADIIGDSLALAIEAAKVKEDNIIMCGVHFMAETAKIMSPEKKVFLPNTKAGCSLAASITGQDVINLKKKYPGIPVVSYVNTTADVKALDLLLLWQEPMMDFLHLYLCYQCARSLPMVLLLPPLRTTLEAGWNWLREMLVG